MALYRLGHTSDHLPFVAAAQDAGLSLTLQQLQQLLAVPQGVFYVAAVGPKPAAFLLGQRLHEDLEIFDIVVCAQQRRQGLARGLLRHAAQEGHPAPKRLLVEVAADNLPALALYRAVGFEQTGRRPQYYRRPGAPYEDALLLEQRL